MTEFSDAIREAKRAVEETGIDPDTPVGTAAFTELLRTILAGTPHEPAPRTKDPQRSSNEQVEDPFARVAKWAEVPLEGVQDIAFFGPDHADIQLHVQLLPASKAGRQRLLTILKLGIERIGYDHMEISARDVNALCTEYDCMDQNLPANLAGWENFIMRRGSRGSAVYRLTQFGVEEAREQLRTLIRAA